MHVYRISQYRNSRALEQATETVPHEELSDTANPNVTLKMDFVNFPQQNKFVFFLQLCVQLDSNKMFVSF